MTDLEDRILKKNIPGKYSWWEEDAQETDADVKRQHRESQTVQNREEESIQCDTGNAASQIPFGGNARPGSRNTGAKGVMHDHRMAKEIESSNGKILELQNLARLERMTKGAILPLGEEAMSGSAMQERRKFKNISEISKNGDSSSEEDEDDNFMAEYRKKRLDELRQHPTVQRHDNHPSALPLYGEIREVSPVEFSEAIDCTDPFTYLIVHLYEPSVRACNVLNTHLEKIARVKNRCRFLRLRALSAKVDFDPVALPVVMVYRAGELVQNWMRVIPDYLDMSCESFAVTNLLESVVEGGDRGPIVEETCGQRADFDGYDSDDAELDKFCEGFY